MVNFTREVDDKTFANATKVVEVHEYREEICVMDDMCTWTHRDVQSLAVDKKMHSTICTMCTSAHRHIFQCTTHSRVVISQSSNTNCIADCSSANDTKHG